MRKPIIAGNWKMNKTASEAVRLAKQIKVLVADDVKGTEVVLCPPFTALYPVAEVIKGSGIQLGAQDVFWEDEGAYTGEISPVMLKDLGCHYVIVGHSERRTLYGETDEVVVLDAAAPTRLVWRFEEQHHAFRGRWEATLQPLDDGRRTRVAVTQRLNLRHPVARALALVRGRDAAVRLYLGSLAARFAEERPAASSA